MSDSKYVTTAELAAHFNVSPVTIMGMMKSGEIPANTYLRLGRVYRFDLEKIEQALLNHPTETKSPAQGEFDFTEE